MHDGMQRDPIQGQGHEPFKVGNLAIFKSYILCHLKWELATDHGFLNYGTISKFDCAGFVIFVLVSASRDLELGRNVSCEELTVSPVRLSVIIWGQTTDPNHTVYVIFRGRRHCVAHAFEVGTRMDGN